MLSDCIQCWSQLTALKQMINAMEFPATLLSKCPILYLSTGNVPINGVKARLAAVPSPKVLSIASERERCSHQWS